MFLGLLTLALISTSIDAAPKAKLIEFWDDSEENSLFDVDHSPWDDILSKYVTHHDSGVNRFAYEKVTAEDKAKLQRYLEEAQLMDPRQLTRARQKAYSGVKSDSISRCKNYRLMISSMELLDLCLKTLECTLLLPVEQ